MGGCSGVGLGASTNSTIGQIKVTGYMLRLVGSVTGHDHTAIYV